MLAKPSLGMVRLFLLLAFYMLGANHRSAAAIYLGISAKAAVVLGLDNPRSSENGDLTFRYADFVFERDVLKGNPKDHAHGQVYEFSMYLQVSFSDDHKICLHLHKIPFKQAIPMIHLRGLGKLPLQPCIRAVAW